MFHEAAHDRDVEALTWRDVEALPYYLMVIFAAAAMAHGIADEGHALQAMAAKAGLVVLLLGLLRAWSEAEG